MRVPVVELVGGSIRGIDEPGIEGGKLVEFMTEIEPSRTIPRLFIAPGNLFPGMGVFVFMRFAMEFVEPIPIFVR